ncbi:plasmid mobilization relaxosome protein MobC [Fusobacterium necrophorum]|uniref:plasmid mobilization protein n=1 Tax=Fusobacterium necrophorum TaxID=859 RepID=UPI001012B429|nr:plasmid mobilization relaxosome protein MobC [Fusobacterium necrophorum]RXZ28637.1 plasmid mobilization relaxosome protein MobC [Fusobacterium necrophorum]
MKQILRKRNNNIHFMVSDEEKEKIEKLFKNSGYKSKQDFYLNMILDGTIINFDLKNEFALELKKMSTLLNNATNNINQCAKVTNTTGKFSHEDFKELNEIQSSMGKALIEFRLLVEQRLAELIKEKIIKNGSYQNTSH